MWRYFTEIGNKKWINTVLDYLLYKYNNTYHTSIEIEILKQKRK
jgi:hypothetical protein